MSKIYKKVIMDDSRNLLFCTDLHANFSEFIKKLEKCQISLDTQIVCCGNIIDIGKESVPMLISFLEDQNYFWTIGDHEDVMLKANQSDAYFKYWLEIGGATTFNQLGRSGLQMMTKEIAERTPLILEIHYRGKKFGIVNGGVPLLNNEPIDNWEHFVKLAIDSDDFRQTILYGNPKTLKDLTFIESLGSNNYSLSENSLAQKNEIIRLNPYVKNIDYVLSGHYGTKHVLQLNNRIWFDTFRATNDFTFLTLNDENQLISI